jgi:hypothetical protein
MEKLFHFNSSVEVYRADVCVISCYDARFDQALRKYLKRRGFGIYDHVKIPGSAKALADPDVESDRDFVLRAIRTSRRLHAPGRILLVGHNDCGAYPGAAPETIVADLRRAAAFLRDCEPDLPAECYFHDFDGIYGIGNTATAADLR